MALLLTCKCLGIKRLYMNALCNLRQTKVGGGGGGYPNRNLNPQRPEVTRDGGIVNLGCLLFLDQASGEHDAIAVIVQLDGEDQQVPVPVRALDGQVRFATKAATINVGFARVGHGAQQFTPVVAELGELLKKILADKPRALVPVHGGEVIVDVLPDAVTIQDL